MVQVANEILSHGRQGHMYLTHYNDVIMGTMASQITSLTIVYSGVYSDADQRKHQSSASLAFVWGIQRWPVNSSHKWPETRKMFPFDDVIMLVETMATDDQLTHGATASIAMLSTKLPRTFWTDQYFFTDRVKYQISIISGCMFCKQNTRCPFY